MLSLLMTTAADLANSFPASLSPSAIIAALVLVSALSIDALAVGFGYGADKIRIPILPALIITLLSSAVLLTAMLLGSLVGSFLPSALTMGICCAILIIMGLVKLFDSLLKGYILRHQRLEKDIKFRFLSLSFILKIYADPKTADGDSSKTLSVKESVSLAIVLSLDSLAVGMGAGASQSSPLVTAILSIAFTIFAIYLGGLLGRALRRKITKNPCPNFSWVSGTMLIILALVKLFT